MIRRVLVANRGEIALRIIRACREMGVETVAAFSEVDARAPHARAADIAVAIGPPAAGDSYLRIDKLIAAARASGADAIHPGYGFLSENADFADACAKAGIVFIGPSGDTIRLMGSKIGARRLMADAGVPVVPGETPKAQDNRSVLDAVERVGYPALVKASAGGGGKGMRIVRSRDEAQDLVAAAKREAAAAFADGTVYVERLIERPRHVEIQVFADAQGNVVHLFERECSIQRRHQKIIEESPSPALTDAVRARMGAAAVAAAKAAKYVNAGTIEFLLEPGGDDARFYFLEMNTRLQVEHPVTEAITGCDLVHAQLIVASGERLPWTQKELTRRGHAIECRVYAEDPAREFLPQAGRIAVYRPPTAPGVRVDDGVVEGGLVPVHYDPLIAKLIVHAETREQAIDRAQAALRNFVILGVRTNIPFLLRVLDDGEFRAARMHTGSIDERMSDLGAETSTLPPAVAAAAAAMNAVGSRFPEQPQEGGARPLVLDPWMTLRNWR